jgi:hypothetical protein
MAAAIVRHFTPVFARRNASVPAFVPYHYQDAPDESVVSCRRSYLFVKFDKVLL